MNQNRYLWGVVYKTISLETGYTTQELHALFTKSFCLQTRFDEKGTICSYIASTTAFSTEEMTEYIDSIIRAVAVIDIYVPDPFQAYSRRVSDIAYQ